MKRGILKFVIILPLFFFLECLAPLGAEDSKFIFPESSQTISMDFQDASLKDVLKIFSQQAGLNFIASEAIQDRKVTLYLDKVPVEEALDRILSANSLTYEIQEGSNIFVVKSTGKPSVELITKTYYLKYASVTNSRISQELIAGVASTNKSGDSTIGIREALSRVISSNGRIVEDGRTNSITITDVPSQFPVIEQTLARLDISLPQIMIDVQMVDVSKVVAEQMGIKLGQTPLAFTGGTRQTYFPQVDRIAEKIGSAKAIYTVGTLSMAGLTAALEFLNTTTNTKFLARPRLLTLANQTAEIRITTQEAIGLKVSNTGQAGLLTQTSEAERVETGVSLRVTPQINPDTGEITMYIEPRVAQAKAGGTFGAQSFKDPEERGTKSLVRIRDGETVMVGGLIRTDYTTTITKLPFLGDIPFIGSIFRHKNTPKNEDRELIVFITPHLANETAASQAVPVKMDISREQEIPLAKRIALEKSLADIEKKRR